MNNHTRRLTFEVGHSVAWATDTLSLLPPDAVIAGVAHDVCRNAWVLYICHPDFPAVDTNVEIPELQLKTETVRTLLGRCMLRPDALIDPVTTKEFKPV